jgi:hypothetical protein
MNSLKRENKQHKRENKQNTSDNIMVSNFIENNLLKISLKQMILALVRMNYKLITVIMYRTNKYITYKK